MTALETDEPGFQTSHSRRDLDDIWFYIARDNPEHADRFVDGIAAKCESIAESPYMGRARPELGGGVRSLPHEEYVICYRISGDKIDVLRAIQGARDVGADWIALSNPGSREACSRTATTTR